ncbi:MAG: SMC-Scp complex subunit ScpB [Pseudomonadales bacterium]
MQAADGALTVDQCQKLFRRGELPVSHSETQRELVKRLLEALMQAFEGRGVELTRVASGYRLQVRQDYSRWVSRLWEEKPPRYSRALLETMALIAYRQPVTRGDIENVRGVAVSQNIMRTLSERGWIREVGHREVPGRPALYGTTKAFLDYFNLKSLAQLPPLEEIRELIEPVIIEEMAGAEVDSSADAAVPNADPEADAEPSGDAGNSVAETDEATAGIEVTLEADPQAEVDSADSPQESSSQMQAGTEADSEAQTQTADVVPLSSKR